MMPWKAAVQVMEGYYRDRGEAWPGYRAGELLELIWIKGNRWVVEKHEEMAHEILKTATFDVDDLVEKMGIGLRVESLEHLDHAVGGVILGRACLDAREAIVSPRAQAYAPLYRTTVMHEVGHIILHDHSAQRCLRFNQADLGCSKDRKEREANQFMQVAILPKPVLILGLALVCSLYGISVAEALLVANTQKGRWLWRRRIFLPLINTLCVSRHMMAIKLRNMGVFSKDTANYHLTYGLGTHWNASRQGSPVAPLTGSLDGELQRLRGTESFDRIAG